MLHTLGYALIPALSALIGGAVAAWRRPGPTVVGAIQHFTAGVVFAAVAVELIPEIRAKGSAGYLTVGFSLGVALMLVVRWLGSRMERAGGEDSPRTLVAVVGVDLVVDGAMVGIGFAAGETTGVMLTLALTLEVLFLTLATAGSMLESGWSRKRVVGVSGLFGLLVLGSAALGATALEGLSGAPLTVVMSFGAAALLYLVTEELLVEVHEGETPEAPWVTATFFLGFLIILLMEMTH